MSSKKTPKNKKPEAKTKTKSLSRAELWFSSIVFIAVAVLVFYPPYFRGLFFNEDMFVYHIITALVLILVWVEKLSRKEFNFVETPLDWAVLAYAGAYLLSLTGAVHIGEAIYGFLKALNYFIVYFMVSQVVRDYRRYEYMLKIILASGVGVAAIGILAAVGISQYPSAFTYERHIARILSTLQYPNTTAAYLAIISLIGVTLWIREQSPLMKLIYGTSIYLLILVVLAALSKGAWVIFMLGAVLLFLGMPGIYRFKSVYIMALAGVAAIFTYFRFIAAIPAVTGREPVTALKVLLLGLVIIVLGQAIWELGIVLSHKKKAWLVVYIIFLGLSALYLCYHTIPGYKLAGKITPDTLKARAEGITDTSSSSYTSRLDFARWGVEIIKDHPVSGTGAGGWNALYHQYQDYLTWTTETHNHFIQVWVEAGTLGFIAFISIWICIFLALFRIYKVTPSSDSIDYWVLNWGTATAALALGVHAAMDFDLSLGAMTILLWTLFALVNAGNRINAENTKKRVLKPVINISLAVVAAFIMLFFGSNFCLANNYAREGEGLLMEISKPGQTALHQQDKLTTAQDLFSRAEMADPYNANYHVSLAQAYSLRWSQAAQSKNPAADEYYEKARHEIRRAGELGPYNIKLRNALVNLCLGLNDLEGAVEQARWSVKANPNDINAYEGLMQLSLKAAEFYLNQNNLDKASYYAREIVKQPDEIKIQSKKINPERPWSGKLLTLSPVAQLTLGKAQFLLGQYQEALSSMEHLVSLAQSGSLQAPETMAWYLACLDKKGNNEKTKALLSSLEKSGAQNVQLYRSLTELAPLPQVKQESR